MQVQLSGHHIDITPALRDHVQSKLDRLNRLYENIKTLAVVLCVDNAEKKAEATISVAGATLHADAVEADMYASIDTMFEKLVVQLRKHKEKQSDHHQREARDLNHVV
jgi:putative sigma-54 modulation protein